MATEITEEMFQNMSISTRTLLQEAVKRGLDIEVISDTKNTYILRWQGKELVCKATAFDNSTSMTRICDDKYLTSLMLKRWGFPVPENKVFSSNEEEQAWSYAQDLGDIVVKPLDAAHGNGVTVLPKSKEDFLCAWNEARDAGKRMQVLVEEYVHGEDYRLFFVGDTCIFINHRIAAHVVGDGRNSIENLIIQENQREDRGTVQNTYFYTQPYCQIQVDEKMRHFLSFIGLRLDSVPAAGQKVFLNRVCNIGQGGTIREMKREVQPQFLAEASILARKLGMRVMAMDIRCTALEEIVSLQETRILELNATPGIVTDNSEQIASDIWDALVRDFERRP